MLFSFEDLGAWGRISLLLAIIGGLFLYFLFLTPENSKRYTGFTKKVYNFLSFKTLSVEAILKISYLVFAIFLTLISFSFISTSFTLFIALLTVGNIVLRAIYEYTLLFILMYHELRDVNKKR